MDITYINLYPNKLYLYVVVDNYSHFLWDVPMTSERAKAVCFFLLQCSPVTGVPHTIKLIMTHPTLVNLFSHSVMNGKSILSRVFPLILREKASLNVLRGPSKLSYKKTA